MAETSGERTEAPTAKRKQKARDEGQILKSREFATALVVLAGVTWFAIFGRSLVEGCAAVMRASLTFDHGDIEDFAPLRPLAQAGTQLAPGLVSLLAIAAAAALLSQAGLGGLRANWKLLAPKPSRLNPASGLKRIVGASGWIELVKSLLKVALLGAIGAYMLWSSSRLSLGLAASDVPHAVGAMGTTLTTILFAMAAGLVGIAALDVPVQLVRLLGTLRMSKQEVKDENKESEGSPEVKQQLRARQRDMAKRSARATVKTAHVVLTNPTHFAVALRYDRANDQVPVVVAKGRGETALAIRELATEFATPVLEYPQLARAVYYTSREGQEIRDDLYIAVATVLAFVFGLDARAAATQPAVDVPKGARFDENGVLDG